LGPWLYGLLVLFMLTAAANAVNLTDGLDGLAAGSGGLVFGAFVLIAFWQSRNPIFYGVEGATDLAIVAAAIVGAALGFLWWNAAPAHIFMGDVGSQALGGALAALALLTNTHLLLIVLGGLYVMITVSVILQVFTFRVWGRRIFLMAPIHHHFELKGWPETTIIIRFWIMAGLGVAVGVGVFYADFLRATNGGVLP
jgi:phospho-N-acetylmuramoyl-pentapeptide-transferase